MSGPFRVCVAGVGGFARAHHSALQALEHAGRVSVVAACDPVVDGLGETCREFSFEERDVAVFADFDEMMAFALRQPGGLDWVSLATPIPAHDAMHAVCVASGVGCYLEKPPTLAPDELEAMILRDQAAEFRTQVGFNYIQQPPRLALKERLGAGDFGALRQVGFLGAWRRSTGYFSRNSWAGRLMFGGRPLLDSCLGNGMSHHIHNILFFCGREGVFSWGDCTALESELYRVNDIECPDTLFVRGLIDHDITFRFALTNACAQREDWTAEYLECERASIRITPGGGIGIFWHDGRREELPLSGAGLMKENFGLFMDYLEGVHPRPGTLLEDCRPLVHLNAMAFLASPRIHRIPEAHWEAHPEGESGDTLRAIRDVGQHLRAFVDAGRFPSETGCAWGRRGGRAYPRDLERLGEHVQTLSARETAGREAGEPVAIGS